MTRSKDVPTCDERLRLGNEVSKAEQNNYAAKAAYDRAKDTTAIAALAVKLATARTAERNAVSALDKHKKEHGC